MYTRGMLNGFSDQIADPDEQRSFKMLIRKIPFFRSGGGSAEKCEHASVETLGVSLGIAHLTAEFFQRFAEFLSAADFDSVTGAITHESMAAYIASITPEISDEQLESN